jgi:hypothetical protein
MLGLIAAAIFALAFVLDLIDETIGDITTTTLLLAGRPSSHGPGESLTVG